MTALRDGDPTASDMQETFRSCVKGSDRVLLEVSSACSRDEDLSLIARGLQAATERSGLRLMAVGIVRGLFRLVRNALFSLSMWRSGRNPDKEKNPVTLIDCFVLGSQISDGIWKDRYYNGLGDLVPEGNVRFVPTFLIWKRVSAARTAMDLASVRFVFPQDYLTLGDYASALIFPFKLRRIYRDVGRRTDGLTALALRAEWWNDLFGSPTFRSMLLYKSLLRMGESGMQVSRGVDWNEHQPIDRAFVMGLRKAWPGATVAGFRGYLASRSRRPSLIPTQGDLDAGVFPDELFVMGQREVEWWTRTFERLNIFPGPSLRYPHLFEDTEVIRPDVSDDRFLNVVVALPIYEGEASRMLAMTLDAFSGQDPAIRVRVQAHPSMTLSTIGALPEEWPDHITPSAESLSDLLSSSDVLVSSSSSGTGLEALAAGIRVVYLNPENDPPLEGILESSILDSTVKWAQSASELGDAITAFSDTKPPPEGFLAVKNAYFTRPDHARARLMALGPVENPSTEED